MTRAVCTAIASVALFVLQTGCVEESMLRVPFFAAGQSDVGYRVAMAESSDEVLMGLPEDSMRSEVALLSLTDTHACFEIVMRTWNGAERAWLIWAESDDEDGPEELITLNSCTTDTPCLEQPSRLTRIPSDDSPRVMISGGSYCAPIPAMPTQELAFNFKQGAVRRRFVFHATD